MSSLDTKMTAIAEQVLKRPLTEEEQLDIYKISDAMGMNDVQSFLHQLLVFKLHEDTLKKQVERIESFERRMDGKFAEMTELENRINDTLENSIERILGEGAERIGADMGDVIAGRAAESLTAVGEYHSLRGKVFVVGFLSIVLALAYWFGSVNALGFASSGGPLEALLFLPAGWCVFFCGVTYTFFWVGDHWKRIKRTILYKTFLGLQLFFLVLLASMLL